MPNFLYCLVLVLIWGTSLQVHGRPRRADDKLSEILVKYSRPSGLSVKEMVRLKALKPLIDYPNIMFWRPQKVGSSTILSLLISFGYRYNLLLRRRSIGGNFICRKIALCAYEQINTGGEASISDTSGMQGATVDKLGIAVYTSVLKDYVSYGHWPLVRADGSVANVKKSSRGKRQHIQERVSEHVGPYHISGDHMMCFLDPKMISDHLPCAFTQLSQSNILASEDPRDTARSAILDTSNTTGIRHLTTELQKQGKQAPVKELFVIRDPMSRIISIYYFWGELYRVKALKKDKGERVRLGQEEEGASSSSSKGGGLFEQLTSRGGMRRMQQQQQQQQKMVNSLEGGGIKGGLFRYHGNETTVPSDAIAEEFADRVVLARGMPGPSISYSAFAQSKEGAIEALTGSDRIMTIVTERMTESLVVATHYMGWSLADVVVVSPRKALSKHPGYKQWPRQVVDKLRRKLENYGEFDVYQAANAKLDQRIEALESDAVVGVSVHSEVLILQALRERVGEKCLSIGYLTLYRAWISGEAGGDEGSSNSHDWVLPQHQSDNKLRDSDHYFSDEGHTFDFNKDKIISYDVCGACEAHAIMKSISKQSVSKEKGVKTAVEARALIDAAPLLKDIKREDVVDSPHFNHCPVGITL